MPNKKTPFLRDRPELPDQVMEIIRAIAAEGGQTLLVGGYVRDLAAGTNSTSKDLDLEVHRLTLDQVEALLGRFGDVDLVGRQFGVFRLHGLDVDWSVPRIDSHGRHPEVTPDPWMGIDEAARRRDLTINSMAIDPLENTFFDPYNGLADMEQGLLRATDPKLFVEDPLRFFRVMSFAARMEMRVEPGLTTLCATMDLHDVARERIDEEFTKMFLRSRRPSLGLRWIDATGRLDEILPEVGRIKGVEQDPEWHPEGDVWKHTLQVVDAAAALRIDDKEQDLMLLWAALGHDLGKAVTTLMLDGRIRSPGHTEASGELVERLMERIVSSHRVRKGTAKMSVHHLKPHDFQVNNASPRAFKRLALKLAPETSLERLAVLALADHRGRNPDGDEPLEVDSPRSGWFLDQAKALKVNLEPEAAVLMGRHLLDCVKPGPAMGRMLKRAYEIQLAENEHDVKSLKKRVLAEHKDLL